MKRNLTFDCLYPAEKLPASSIKGYFPLWHVHWHLTIFMSNEQSWSGPHASPTGHSPGQSPWRSRLQKKVSIRSRIGVQKI
jgi:hypothetical protein